jgi:ABC-type sugar transport system ATPase subunit
MSTEAPTISTHPNGRQPDGPALLSLRGITKTFGPVQALTKIDLDLPPGKVTALAGDNGAGKSVTIKTISGLWAPDDGEILWEGRPVHLHGPRDAEALGITTIYQDLALCDNLDIVANMFLGHEPLRWGVVLDEGKMETAARETLKELKVTTVRSIRQPVASLSGGQRQSVAIAKAVLWESRLVVMDEPTAALGVAQTAMVLELVRTLADRGHAVLLVTHNVPNLLDVADRVAVMRQGRVVDARERARIDQRILVDLMTTGSTDREVA